MDGKIFPFQNENTRLKYCVRFSCHYLKPKRKVRFEFFKASELVVTPAEPTAWSLDGEYKRTEGAVHIRNLHGAINFIK